MIGLSSSQLTRKMNKIVGNSPGKYILQIRLLLAKNLLSTVDESIKNISITCGFSSYQVFWQAFEKRFNQSPGAYARTYKKLSISKSINWNFPPENSLINEIIIIINNDPWFYDFLSIIIQNVENKNLTIDKLSKELCCSASGLTRHVKKRIGTTPISFINQIRILRAVDYIESKQYSSVEIAYRLGYSDQSHFCRSFKSELGMSISEFKRKRPLFLRFMDIESILG